MTQQPQKAGHFADLGLPDVLLRILTKRGFTTPTPIQGKIIPTALSGRDVVGIAQTGTGKTLAFGIPMLAHLANSKKQGLILVPTRELAEQVYQSLSPIGQTLGLKMTVVIGGASRQAQVRSLKSGSDIVIATPGRLVDLITEKDFSLANVGMITFDEADRMLDMGFLPQIKRVLQTAPKERQTMLFSATMPSSIEKLLKQFMQNPYRVDIAPQGTTNERIEQEIFIIPTKQRMRMIDALLDEYEKETILIFSRTKFGAKRIARDIRNMGHSADEIHSNRSQAQRKKALAGFTSKKYRVLVATDIAARGIDVPHVALVINYDLPESVEDYVHRIGRTGRAGRHGKAISFAALNERGKIKQIERLMRKSIPVLPLPELPPEREKPAFSERPERKPYRSNGRSRGKAFAPRTKPDTQTAPADRSHASYSPKRSHSRSESSFAKKRSPRDGFRNGSKKREGEFKKRSSFSSYKKEDSRKEFSHAKPKRQSTRSRHTNDFGAPRRKRTKFGAKRGKRQYAR